MLATTFRYFMPCLFTTISLFTSACWSQIEPRNPNTDWFQEAGYGVFVHYLDALQNNEDAINSLGRATSWDECVRAFDTEQFAETMAEAGAGYVIFTMMQVTRHMIAPNETYDHVTGYVPGEACAARDLVEDLYTSLHKRNIPLMLYWTGDGPRGDAQAAAGFGCRFPVTTEFVQRSGRRRLGVRSTVRRQGGRLVGRRLLPLDRL